MDTNIVFTKEAIQFREENKNHRGLAGINLVQLKDIFSERSRKRFIVDTVRQLERPKL